MIFPKKKELKMKEGRKQRQHCEGLAIQPETFIS